MAGLLALAPLAINALGSLFGAKRGGRVGKKQGYNARLDESLGMRHRGKKKQGLKARRDESKAMEKALGRKAYSAVKTMDRLARANRTAPKARRGGRVKRRR